MIYYIVSSGSNDSTGTERKEERERQKNTDSVIEKSSPNPEAIRNIRVFPPVKVLLSEFWTRLSSGVCTLVVVAADVQVSEASLSVCLCLCLSLSVSVCC